MVSGRCCLMVAGLLAPWIAIAALPFFRFGIWIDAEPTLVVYHWIAALFALGIFFDCLSSSPSLKDFINPVLGLIFVLILLSLAMMPFALDRGLTWYGLPQTGQGILSLIGFVFYLLGFKRLLDRGQSQFLWVNTAIAAMTISSITLIGNFSPENPALAEWSPYVFSAFLAFMAIGLLALSLTAESRMFRFLGVGVACVLVLLSSNKTAMVGLLCVLVILESKTLSEYLKKNARGGLSLIVGTVPLLILISMVVFSSPTRLPSVWSRLRLIQMVGLEMLEHPWRLLVGWGWGSYTDTFLANLTRVSEAMYQNGVWNPTWDALNRVDFHSHHQVIEALLSTGVMGALIVLLLPTIAVYSSDREKLMAAFAVFFLYATTSSGWFEMPATLPFIALSYAAFWPKASRWKLEIPSKIMLSLSGVAVVICFSGGMRVFDVGITYPSANSLITKNFGKSPPVSCDQARRAAGPGGVHLAHSLRSVVNESAYYEYANKQIVEEIQELVCAARSIKQPTLALTMSLLALIGDLAKEEQFPWVKPLREQLLPKWRPMLKAMLIRAPYRTDLLAPYFRWQIEQGNGEAVKEWCEQILIKNPNDPIALWFKGLILKDMPGKMLVGYRFLNRALMCGISRLLPIRPKFQKQIEEYQE